MTSAVRAFRQVDGGAAPPAVPRAPSPGAPRSVPGVVGRAAGQRRRRDGDQADDDERREDDGADDQPVRHRIHRLILGAAGRPPGRVDRRAGSARRAQESSRRKAVGGGAVTVEVPGRARPSGRRPGGRGPCPGPRCRPPRGRRCRRRAARMTSMAMHDCCHGEPFRQSAASGEGTVVRYPSQRGARTGRPASTIVAPRAAPGPRGRRPSPSRSGNGGRDGLPPRRRAGAAGRSRLASSTDHAPPSRRPRRGRPHDDAAAGARRTRAPGSRSHPDARSRPADQPAR